MQDVAIVIIFYSRRPIGTVVASIAAERFNEHAGVEEVVWV